MFKSLKSVFSDPGPCNSVRLLLLDNTFISNPHVTDVNLCSSILVAALPDDIENRVSNVRPTTTRRALSLAATGTCPGTPLSCQPTQFATSYVTSGTVLIKTTVTTVLTSVYDRTVTLPTTVPIAHSCFTYLIPTPQSNNEFCGPFTSQCGPTNKCTVTSTTAVKQCSRSSPFKI